MESSPEPPTSHDHWSQKVNPSLFPGEGDNHLFLQHSLSQTQTRLEESEERYRFLFRNNPRPMFIMDMQSLEIIEGNESAIHLYGYSKQEFEKLTVLGLKFEEDRQAAIDGLAKAVKGYNKAIITRHRKKDGSEILMEASAQFFNWDGREVLLIEANDITENFKAREALEKALADVERSNRELEQFAYIASHDLQEPLRTIASYLQLLEKKHTKDLKQEALEFIGITIDAVKRLQMLIDSLLHYSRLGNRKEEWAPVNINQVLKDLCTDLSTSIETEKAKIEIEEPMPIVVGEAVQIGQLFQNLIANSIKFHKKEVPPYVRITWEKKKSMIQFCISDNGIGMEKKYFNKIFLIFQKLHNRSEYPGAGIGLSICKKIVSNHGGKIWVESSIGNGTEFYFTLPLRPKT
ncbi:hypothetical protein CH373_05640 [Leptospira perolatii]|uniref:histidine kinase n=1 Tax=Leptospira perolatii TaxID=2023191 RepID=A0A2M9ZQS4_9LEPT|nr:ATP-binding protein [Leptospira perolatii]PJZ70549.1 hypothetical protein CH360_06060 [Leptospira perolatii]PJZ74385.1 hypothetical protein CH373_05640 [Leptospira perolatii]